MNKLDKIKVEIQDLPLYESRDFMFNLLDKMKSLLVVIDSKVWVDADIKRLDETPEWRELTGLLGVGEIEV